MVVPRKTALAGDEGGSLSEEGGLTAACILARFHTLSSRHPLLALGHSVLQRIECNSRERRVHRRCSRPGSGGVPVVLRSCRSAGSWLGSWRVRQGRWLHASWASPAFLFLLAAGWAMS